MYLCEDCFPILEIVKGCNLMMRESYNHTEQMGEKQFCGAIGSQKLQEPPAHFARFWTAKLQMSNMRGLGQLEVPFQDDTFTPKNCLFVFPDIQ